MVLSRESGDVDEEVAPSAGGVVGGVDVEHGESPNGFRVYGEMFLLHEA
jgi:hypothetical protein